VITRENMIGATVAYRSGAAKNLSLLCVLRPVNVCSVAVGPVQIGEQLAACRVKSESRNRLTFL